MKAQLFLFRNTPKVWYLVFVLLLIAIGCQDGCTCGGCNGCTTSVVVDQESRKYKADGVPVKLTANKNKVTNRKLRLRENSMIDKTVWYTIDYHIRIEKRPEFKNICEYEVPKKMDMKKALAAFNIKFSPDKKHFAVGINELVYDFFHLLDNGVPFSSGCYYLKDSNAVFLNTAGISFNKINWKVFPQPDKLLDEIIVPNSYSVWVLSENQNNVLELLREMPPGNPHEMVLMENWYCEMAYRHFTQQRVEEILKVSPEWKRNALVKLLEKTGNAVSENDQELERSLDMILWINDKNALAKADSLVFDEYYASGYAGDYFLERLKDKTTPPDRKITTSLVTTARRISNKFEDSDKMSAGCAIDILLIEKENNELSTFLENYLKPDSLADRFYQISPVTIGKFELYPQDLQTLMIAKYFSISKIENSGLTDFDISGILEFLKDKISCEELKKLVELHKNHLVGFTMPKGC